MPLRFFLLLFIPLFSSHANTWDAASWRSAPPRSEDISSLREKLKHINELSSTQLFEQACANKEFVSHGRPEIEWHAWRLAHLYRLTGDTTAAEKTAIILAGLASRQLPDAPFGIHIEGKWIPYPAVIAYGMIAEAPVWPIKIAEDLPEATRDVIVSWLRGYEATFAEIVNRPGQVTNYTPFGLRRAAALALVLENGKSMQFYYQVAERLAFSKEFWYADAIWQEGTVSYARQVSGNLKSLLPMLRAGISLEGSLYGEADIERLDHRLNRINEAQADFRMPSGRPIPVNDTHWSIPSDSTPRSPRAIAFPDFAHYAIPGRDIEAHLSLPTLTGGGRYGGGHQHDSRLSLQLWAHGQEVLPDAGYPFQPANHRYFHMSPLAHNMSLALDETGSYEQGPYGVWNGSWARSTLLGLDEGRASGGRVSYVAAASPGPEREKISKSERQLLHVATGAWSGYLVDCFWLRGGTIHRSFLRQTEDEAVGQSVDVPLSLAGKTMADVLGEPSEGDKAWSNRLSNPQQVLGDEGFKITWLGEASNVELNLFIAPQPGSTSWLSHFPRLRPTRQDPAKRDAFPGWHLMRQRLVEPTEWTLWAAVYEPVADGASKKIHKVKWQRTEDGTGLLLEVFLQDRVDTWLLGQPEHPFALKEHALIGRAAGYSQSGGKATWSWAASGSRLSLKGELLADGGSDAPRRVRKLSETGGLLELVVDGTMDLPEEQWASLEFADGSGRGIFLDRLIDNEVGSTRFALESDPGLRIEEGGMTRTTFPEHSIPELTHIRPLGGYYKVLNQPGE